MSKWMLDVADNVYVCKDEPDRCFPDASRLYMSGEFGMGGNLREKNYCFALLRFDLTELRGRHIEHIQLRLKTAYDAEQVPYNVLEILGISEPYACMWSASDTYATLEEKHITENFVGQSIPYALIDTVQNETVYSVDVTDFVQDCLFRGQTTVCFKLQRERQHFFLAYNTNGKFSVYSKNSSMPAQLIVTDEADVPAAQELLSRDPMKMDDAEFFEKLSAAGNELQAVKDAARAGNMRQAKCLLLAYYQHRTAVPPYLPALPEDSDSFLRDADTVWYDLYNFDAQPVNTAAVTGTDWQCCRLPLAHLKHGTVMLMELEKNGVKVEISCEDKRLPWLEIGKEAVRRNVVSHTYIQAGVHAAETHGQDKILVLSEDGMPLSDETCRAYLDFGVLDARTCAQPITLCFYARTSAPDLPHAIAVFTGGVSPCFDPATFCWKHQHPQVYSYRDAKRRKKGFYSWTIAPDADPEYANAVSRLGKVRSLAAAYRSTGEERYARAGLEMLMHFYRVRQPAYPRWLDVGWRVPAVVCAFFAFLQSPAMTPEICTALLKFIYAQVEFLNGIGLSYSNQGSAKLLGQATALMYLPELERVRPAPGRGYADAWDQIEQEAADLYGHVVNPDGSYREGVSTGYSNSVLGEMIKLSQMTQQCGRRKLPDNFARAYAGLTEYICQCHAPFGQSIAYGDSVSGTMGDDVKTAAADMQDPALLYMTTGGQKGQKPALSRIYPDSKIVMSRQDWFDPNALYMVMNASTNEMHGHLDALHLEICGFGRFLLRDSGSPVYGGGNPDAYIPPKTISHNTVSVNGNDQQRDAPSDIVLYTDRNTDFIRGSLQAYPDFSHARYVLFLKKENCWLVSDVLQAAKPDGGENVFMQAWHPDLNSQLEIDAATCAATTFYPTGGNIQIVPLQAEHLHPTLHRDGFVNKIPNLDGYLTYDRTSCDSVVTFHTLLYPRAAGVLPAAISAKPIAVTGDASQTAFAAEISLSADRFLFYCMDALHPCTCKYFGGFSTSAAVCCIVTDAEKRPLCRYEYSL